MNSPEIRSILILGGTGRTGKYIIDQALQKGYKVTLLARDPSKLNGMGNNPLVEIIKGDVLHYPDIYNAVQGNDVILSALGRDEKKQMYLPKAPGIF